MGAFLGGFAAGAVCVAMAEVIAVAWLARSGGAADLFDFGGDPRTEKLASGETPDRRRGQAQ